jgi:hypothetical protein
MVRKTLPGRVSKKLPRRLADFASRVRQTLDLAGKMHLAQSLLVETHTKNAHFSNREAP